ncbi:MAG: aspartate 1-decarboxylase [Candidatus Delongbacteria bacterium]|nr:aspartate 1-decarboxylase [Candidatus Delongbacteria bacterium]MBN2834013.1 aspartate 1-decarboxylase [Candidatus Delongbacteria bacterium]
MLRTVKKSKIHRAVVTEANLNYEGSLTIDKDLMEAADILENEQIHVVNINNGKRAITYAIPGERGSKVICLNGAIARDAQPGDLVIIITYAQMNEEELKNFKSLSVLVNERNEIKQITKD